MVAWLHEHPGAHYVWRDGSGSYGEAIRQALPEAVRASEAELTKACPEMADLARLVHVHGRVDFRLLRQWILLP